MGVRLGYLGNCYEGIGLGRIFCMGCVCMVGVSFFGYEFRFC